MTRKEKQKAIYALKKSVPVMAMTHEEFNDYIQTLNKVMYWLEQEPCNDAISRKAVINILNEYRAFLTFDRFKELICTLPPVTPQEPKSEWEHDHEILKAYSNGANEVLDKVRAEIQTIIGEHNLDDYDFCSGLIVARKIIDKYKAESEG